MKLIIVVFLVISFMVACSQQENVSSEKPDRVKMVQKEASFDTLDVERGIDAVPNEKGINNFIQIMWFKHNDEYKISYYKIYRSIEREGNRNFNLLATTVYQTNPLDTIYIDEDTQDMSAEDRYFYYITAVNEDDKESLPSDTVHYTLIAKAVNLSLNNNASVITKTELNFTWEKPVDFSPHFYILRMELYKDESFHPLVLIRQISDYHSTVYYTISGEYLKDIFIKEQNYRWRVDCVGDDLFKGSESDWAGPVKINLE